MTEKKDVYEIVTDRIIEQLEKGVIPWKKGWHGTIDGAFNRVTKRPYSLLNQMLLSEAGEYATFKQWKDAGGHIKKGAKSELVTFWKVYPVKETVTKIVDGKEVTEERIKNLPLLRYYNVFHISQVEGVKPLNIEQSRDFDPIEKAEEVINNYVTKDNLFFQNDVPSDRAFYAPASDRVVVPMLSQFDSKEEYYSTTFHELTHSTKHEKRLNRGNESISAFGSQDYSKEELVAEIGAANMLSYLGIETPATFKNSAAYIQNWLQVLKNDKKMIVSASSKAQKATDYILSFTEEIDAEEA